MNRLYQSTNLLQELRSSLVIAEKDARIYYIKPPVIIYGILFPVFFFLAFGLGKQLLPYVLVPGLVVMTLFFTSSSVGPLVTPGKEMPEPTKDFSLHRFRSFLFSWVMYWPGLSLD